MPGVMPLPGVPGNGGAAITWRVTVTVVLAVFQVQPTAAVAQSSVSTVPSWSWRATEPTSSLSVIASLNVIWNASPASMKSDVPTLTAIRASTRVGGVKSPAPVVNVSVAGDTRSFPTTSWISLASGVNVTVYVLSAGNAEFITNEKDVSAASGEKPQEFAPAATTTGSLVAVLLSVKVISVLSKLSAVQ